MPVQILCKMDEDAAVEHNQFILLVVADSALVQMQRFEYIYFEDVVTC